MNAEGRPFNLRSLFSTTEGAQPLPRSLCNEQALKSAVNLVVSHRLKSRLSICDFGGVDSRWVCYLCTESIIGAGIPIGIS